MEKELDRLITLEELFKVTHIKKKKRKMEPDSWVEPWAQETHEKYMQRLDEFRSTQSFESRGTPLTQEQEDQFWQNCAGAPIRGSAYGRLGKAYKKKTSRLHCGSSSTADDIDSASSSLMQSRIVELTSELAAVADRAKQRELENERRFQLLQSQLDTLFQSSAIIPPYPGNARRREAGVGLLDDYSTEEEEEFEDEDEEV